MRSRARLQVLLAGLAATVLTLALALTPAAEAKTRKVSCGLTTTLFSGAPEPVPVELNTTPEASVLESFAVLRRAATPSDLIPPISPVGEQLSEAISSYYPAYIREIVSLPNGTRDYLVPALLKPVSVPPAGCLPPSLRSKRGELVAQEHKRASELGFCIAEIGGSALAGREQCGLFSELAAARRPFDMGLFSTSLIELAPDGVAAVRIVFANGPVTVPVSENAYRLQVPAALVKREKRAFDELLGALRAKHLSKARRKIVERRAAKGIGRAVQLVVPRKLEWLSASGAVIRVLSPPSKGKELEQLVDFIGLL